MPRHFLNFRRSPTTKINFRVGSLGNINSRNDMRLSLLQKYILKQCYLEGGKIKREGLDNFYLSRKIAPQKSEQVKIITQSLERLIERGLMVGYGVRTPQKWFIREIRLTPMGKKQAKRVLGEQQKLPLK